MTDVDIGNWTLVKSAHRLHIGTWAWLARHVNSTCLLMPHSWQLLCMVCSGDKWWKLRCRLGNNVSREASSLQGHEETVRQFYVDCRCWRRISVLFQQWIFYFHSQIDLLWLPGGSCLVVDWSALTSLVCCCSDSSLVTSYCLSCILCLGTEFEL